jgi:hypothetical protein
MLVEAALEGNLAENTKYVRSVLSGYCRGFVRIIYCNLPLSTYSSPNVAPLVGTLNCLLDLG